MSREEKEEYVIRLYKENRSIREIAKIMHMSFRDIGAIINKWKEEIEREKGQLEGTYDYDVKSKSKITQAIHLFSEGKNPVEVVIALDLPIDEVRAIYREFWELKGMYKLAQIYEEAKYDLHTLLRLHKIVKDLGMGEQEIINTLKLANNNEITYLQERMDYLRTHVSWLEIERKNKEYNLSILNNRTRELTYRAIPLEDKSIRQVSSNMGLPRRNDFNKINDVKIYDDSDTEVIYASGDWRNVIR
jgi:transposase